MRHKYHQYPGMDIQMAVLCDFATDYKGKFCVLGCFDSLQSDHLPLVRREFIFALRLITMAGDDGPHQFSLNLVDADGAPLIREKMPILLDVEFHLPKSAEFLVHNYVLSCYGLRFEKYGEYSFDLSINGILSARVPFRVEAEGRAPIEPQLFEWHL